MRSNSGKKNSSGQFRFLPLLVICLAGVATAVDFTVIISLGPVSSLPQEWQDILKNYVVQGSAQASFYEEEEGDPGIPPDNSGTIINEVNNALNGSGTACCPTVTVDENGNAHVNIGVSGGTGGLTNQTINVTLGNVTVPIFLNNITAIAERKSKDNTVIVIALAVTLGTCSILAAAAFYYWYYRKHHGGSADKTSSLPEARPHPSRTGGGSGAGNDEGAVMLESGDVAQSVEVEIDPGTGQPSKKAGIASKRATYNWNAAANAVADPKPGGDVRHMADVAARASTKK